MSKTELANNKAQHNRSEKLKAAYALNMCTVSISQIIDYHDSYILEQEYDAILNNLNLKEMPKDEALLKILSALLDTITFFRIQDIKKQQIEKKYQKRMKDAIWSAIPNLSFFVSGNPVAMAMSLATQIGTGYMNYRKEKASISSEREDSEVELQISAIEQFNGLRRELFTTAWRLADEYDFDDEWRLTEKQIKQYNEILMDHDEIRKYARLEAISDKFEAYPPFWYFYGHTANSIAESAKIHLNRNASADLEEISKNQALVKEYKAKARAHYEHYYSIYKDNNNLLREDQLTASFALEYVDLLWDEENKDKKKIRDLVSIAEKMAPTSFDILQLCAVSYLKMGETADASRLLKILVNEEYNTISNAKLLSMLYSNSYLSSCNTDEKNSLLTSYVILKDRVDPLYLYPWPETDKDNGSLEAAFINNQKGILKKAYRLTIDAFAKRENLKFNAVLPLPQAAIKERDSFYGISSAAKVHRKNVIERELSRSQRTYNLALKECRFRIGYIQVLNDTVLKLCELPCFNAISDEERVDLIHKIEGKIRNANKELSILQERMEAGVFDYKDYCTLVDNYPYQQFTQEFFSKTKNKLCKIIENTSELHALEALDSELITFCENNDLPEPGTYLHNYQSTTSDQGTYVLPPFSLELLGESEEEFKKIKSLRDNMLAALRSFQSGTNSALIINPDNCAIYERDSLEFDSYFKNSKLQKSVGDFYHVFSNAFAVIDDRTSKDFDLILCVDGVVIIKKNKIRDQLSYGDIPYCDDEKGKQKLSLGFGDTYSNENINIALLKSLFEQLKNIN